MPLPVVSAETMKELRESNLPTRELIQSFCKAQPNIAAAIQAKLGSGDIGLSVITDFAMCWQAFEAEDKKQQPKDPFTWS